MNVDKFFEILQKIYSIHLDYGDLKCVLVDTDNLETEIDGIYLNEKLHSVLSILLE